MRKTRKKIKTHHIAISLIVVAMSVLFFNFSFFGGQTPDKLSKELKSMFYSEITKQKGGKESDYKIDNYYFIFKDSNNAEVDSNDKKFSEKVKRVDALINYCYITNDAVSPVYSAFINYDIQTKKIIVISSQ